jgi:hypothetical protein
MTHFFTTPVRSVGRPLVSVSGDFFIVSKLVRSRDSDRDIEEIKVNLKEDGTNFSMELNGAHCRPPMAMALQAARLSQAVAIAGTALLVRRSRPSASASAAPPRRRRRSSEPSKASSGGTCPRSSVPSRRRRFFGHSHVPSQDAHQVGLAAPPSHPYPY